MKRIALRTLGCKVNTYESEQILQGFIRNGWQSANGPADLYVINTCTVTREADRQARQEIRRCIRENPNARIVVTGCYAEMDGAACADMDGVDLVVGNQFKLKIPELVPRLESGSLPRILTENDVDDLIGLPDPLLSGFSNRARAFIQIQQGCDQGCTFCIIHRARGASRSLPGDDIVAQVQRLADSGFAEFVLCGVDLGAFGQDVAADSDGGQDLAGLLERLLRLDGDFRIRLGSLDPVHINDHLIDLIAGESRICRHLHVSMQSADTLILKRMKRRYDREKLYQVVEKAQTRIPNLVVGADIMAGFPTEDESHFKNTLDAVTDLQVSFTHVFPYSERPGTPAARIPRQVPKTIRNLRAKRLRQAGDAVRHKTLRKFVGQSATALIERIDKDSGDGWGRIDTYLPIVVRDFRGTRGSWVPVDIDHIDDTTLVAAELGNG